MLTFQFKVFKDSGMEGVLEIQQTIHIDEGDKDGGDKVFRTLAEFFGRVGIHFTSKGAEGGDPEESPKGPKRKKRGA